MAAWIRRWASVREDAYHQQYSDTNGTQDGDHDTAGPQQPLHVGAKRSRIDSDLAQGESEDREDNQQVPDALKKPDRHL